jgi:hypothetical protein
LSFWAGQRPIVPFLLLIGPPFFPIIVFMPTALLTGMAGISLHLQWPLTALSYGSFSQREQLFFHYGSNSMPNCRKNVRVVIFCQILSNCLPTVREITYKLNFVASFTAYYVHLFCRLAATYLLVTLIKLVPQLHPLETSF